MNSTYEDDRLEMDYDMRLKESQTDPEYFTLFSCIHFGGDRWWIRWDLFEDKPAFSAWLNEIQKFTDYELIAEMSYLGEKTGNVIIRGTRSTVKEGQ